MKLVAVDVETYYHSKTYSLSKMSTPEYILDLRFECIGWSVRTADMPTPVWMEEDEFRAWLAEQGPLFILSHNALFDMAVLRWRFGYRPAMMADTLGMARAMLGGKLSSLSLASVAQYLGLGAKTYTVQKVDGMRKADIKAAGLWDEYANYCSNDTNLCYSVFMELMRRGFPRSELRVMDMILRCATELRFDLDTDLLHLHLAEVRARKQNLLDRVGMTTQDLRSDQKFALALERLGIDPPTKTSAATGKTTYAFAKTDVAFVELQDDDDPDVQALVAARLGVKSTLEESRTERFIALSGLAWPTQRPSMPVPLRYSGAHTHRLSGEWKFNLQNLPRGGNLRKALVAPKGYKVITRDSSQIEARMTACFCGQDDLVAMFDAGEDVYSSFATDVFGYKVSKKTHPDERFLGKTAILGLGYGMGWKKFQKTVQVQSRNQLGKEMILSDEEAQRVVTTYRTRFPRIPYMWRQLNNSIQHLAYSNGSYLDIAPVRLGSKEIILPNGHKLFYENLRQNVEGEWVYDYGRIKFKRLFGGKLLENIIQALARIVVLDAAIAAEERFKKHYATLKASLPHLEPWDLELALQVHDELVFVVPEELTSYVDKVLEQEMSKRPVWMPNLPLASEGGIGPAYGDTK